MRTPQSGKLSSLGRAGTVHIGRWLLTWYGLPSAGSPVAARPDRTNSATPRSASKRAMLRLSVDWAMPSRAAARVTCCSLAHDRAVRRHLADAGLRRLYLAGFDAHGRLRDRVQLPRLPAAPANVLAFPHSRRADLLRLPGRYRRIGDRGPIRAASATTLDGDPSAGEGHPELSRGVTIRICTGAPGRPPARER